MSSHTNDHGRFHGKIFHYLTLHVVINPAQLNVDPAIGKYQVSENVACSRMAIFYFKMRLLWYWLHCLASYLASLEFHRFRRVNPVSVRRGR